jgi:plasmid maintenance system antidote protein VapI
MSNMKKLFKGFDRDVAKLGAALELSPKRVGELLSGQALITPEMAMHIEDELNLPGGWMSDPSAVYPIPPAQAAAPEDSPAEPPATEPTTPAKPTPGTTAVTRTAAPKKTPAADAPSQPAALLGPAVSQPPKTPDSDTETQAIRRMNLTLLTEQKGEKAALARALGVHESLISLKLKDPARGGRPLTRDFCQEVEKAYSLEAGWMDIPRLELPEKVKRLGGDLPRGRPAKRVPSQVVPAAPTAPAPTAAEPAVTPRAAAPSLVPGGAPEALVLAKALSELILIRASAGTLSATRLLQLTQEIVG